MIDAAFSAVWNLFRYVRPGKNAEPFVSIFCKPLNLRRSTLARMRKVELRRRGVAQVLALTDPRLLPSTATTASAPRTALLSPLHTWPARTPVNASRAASRPHPHDSGPVWVATPSP